MILLYYSVVMTDSNDNVYQCIETDIDWYDQ